MVFQTLAYTSQVDLTCDAKVLHFGLRSNSRYEKELRTAIRAHTDQNFSFRFDVIFLAIPGLGQFDRLDRSFVEVKSSNSSQGQN